MEGRRHALKEPPRVLGKWNDSMGFSERHGGARTHIDSRQNYTAGNSRIFSQPCSWSIISSCLSLQHPAAHFTCLYCPLRGIIQSGHKNTHPLQTRQPSLHSPCLASTCRLDTSNRIQTRRFSQLPDSTKVPRTQDPTSTATYPGRDCSHSKQLHTPDNTIRNGAKGGT